MELFFDVLIIPVIILSVVFIHFTTGIPYTEIPFALAAALKVVCQ